MKGNESIDVNFMDGSSSENPFCEKLRNRLGERTKNFISNSMNMEFGQNQISEMIKITWSGYVQNFEVLILGGLRGPECRQNTDLRQFFVTFPWILRQNSSFLRTSLGTPRL